MKDLYTAQVSATSGRDGSVTSNDGQLQLRLGFPKELGGAGDAPNPEQLFAAGYSACFASSIKAAGAKLSTPTGPVRVDAQAVLSVREDGSYLVSRVALQVHAPGLAEQAESVIQEARRICAYTNATRGLVQCDVSIA